MHSMDSLRALGSFLLLPLFNSIIPFEMHGPKIRLHEVQDLK
jgi:hypothetical protein